MNVSTKLFTFASALAAIFAVAVAAGRGIGPITISSAAPGGHGGGLAHGGPGSGSSARAHGAAGLAATEDGFQLRLATDRLRAGTTSELGFTITGPDRRAVTQYQLTHEKPLHLIVASRDLTTFQHLHPRLQADGEWTVELTLASAGAYKVFTDFAPRHGAAMTLATDLFVEGPFTPKPLPAPAMTTAVDGYAVTLHGTLMPGAANRVTVTVSRDGRPVTDLQPYLGAYGHLVALRAGDLAYLHVHPDGGPGDGRTRPGPDISFDVEVPSTGDYRLFLDFSHAGTVHTAAFTLTAPGPAAQQPSPRAQLPDGAGHGH